MSVNVVLKSVFDDKGVKQAEKAFADIGSNIKVAGAAIGAAFIGLGVVTAKFAGDSIEAAEAVATANARLGQVAKSMGIFGTQTQKVTDRLIKFAEANELTTAVDAEVIKATQAKLLTFKELANTADDTGGAFDRATMAALDLAAAGFGSAETNAIQLGKALQDPIKGITALTRSGVTFTESEKELIKTLVESGDILKAQDMILQSIETQVGGTAAATANASDKMRLAFENVQESVGAALLPTFNKFADQIIAFTPVIANALVPIFEKLAEVFERQVLPRLQQFADWLDSPEGRAAIDDFVTEIGKMIEGLFDFVEVLFENIEAIGEFIGLMIQAAPLVLTAAGAILAIEAALKLATAAQIAFNIAASTNPYVLAATALIGTVVGIQLYAAATEDAIDETNGAKRSAEDLQAELEQLRQSYADGLISTNNFIKKQEQLEGLLSDVTGATAGMRGEFNRFNRLRLDNAIAQMQAFKDATDFADRQLQSFRDSYSYLESIGAVTRRIRDDLDLGIDTTGVGPAPETTAERFAKVQAVIKKAQAAIVNAENQYAATRFGIEQNYQQAVLRLQQDASNKQLALINQSKARITQAFKSASAVSLTDLFDSKAVREVETTVKQLTSRLTVTVTKETERVAFASVGNVINGLKERLTASKALLQNASELASQGFSQTFIEEIISAGTQTGNALADAILSATPESRKELQDLYAELERVGETGAQALADDLYNTFGLATRGLRDQSAQVAQELKDSLEQQNKELATSLAAAGQAFGAAIRDIKDTFLSDLNEFDGWFAGLGKTIDQLLAKMGLLSGKALTETQQALTAATSGSVLSGASVQADVAINQLKQAQGLVIDSMDDVAGAAAYLQARIKAAEQYIRSSSSNAAQELSAAAQVSEWTTALANLQGSAAAGQAAGTVININVKTDTTQSRAMVGKTIGNIVTKYVTTGGQVLVSGNE